MSTGLTYTLRFTCNMFVIGNTRGNTCDLNKNMTEDSKSVTSKIAWTKFLVQTD